MGNLQPSSITNHTASSSLTLPGRHKCSFTADPESFVCYGKVSTVEPIIVIYNSATVHFKSNRFLSLMLVPVLFTVSSSSLFYFEPWISRTFLYLGGVPGLGRETVYHCQFRLVICKIPFVTASCTPGCDNESLLFVVFVYRQHLISTYLFVYIFDLLN